MESATFSDYAEDLRAIIRYLTDKRKDVDEKRIAVAVQRGCGDRDARCAACKKNSALVLMAAQARPVPN